MKKEITRNKKKKTNSSAKNFYKKQWGTERQIASLSNLHDYPTSKAIAFSRLSIIITISFWVMYVMSVIVRQLIDGKQNYQFTVEAFGYLIIVSFLTLSALIYLVARQGALQRFAKHKRVSRSTLNNHFHYNQPSITVLIPSYDEEIQVVRKTILSAALQEYPNIHIVLLIDDDPFKVYGESKIKLEKTRKLSSEIEALLKKPYKHFNDALNNFKKNNTNKRKITEDEILEIAKHYLWAENWLNDFAEKEVIEDHVDVFFADQVLRRLSNDLGLTRKMLLSYHKKNKQISVKYATELYNRLVWIFGARLEFFERKRYASLSREPNKAMNLNSYIGLMGGAYNQKEIEAGIVLMPTKNTKNADKVFDDSEFILTLDADSILLQDYCLRLVYLLQQPNNSDLAVAQTPYSSFRGAPTRIERLSGATTDIQHIIHQGMSYYNATFWVGANAVIRKRAIEDIVEREWVNGFEVKKYIQDHTVIEDTESSIDLAIHGWRLINYPERLSYSATPPDFGSLIIQRRRWANGGLLILPKLWKLVRERKNSGNPISKIEFMIRLNYMASIAWSNIGLIFLLVYPYNGRLLSPLVLLAAIPYFLSMAIDLKYCRYRYTDIINIYGFNLILLPVNIAGTLKSLQQALTTKKTPFARTPKVKNRTASAMIYVIAPLGIVAFSIFTLWRNIEDGNLGNIIFAGFNAVAATWAILLYIGIWNSIVDIWVGLVNFVYVDVKSKPIKKPLKNKSKSMGMAYFFKGK